MSNMMFILIELTHVDGIDLNVLNKEGKYRVSSVDAWKFAFSISGGVLELGK